MAELSAKSNTNFSSRCVIYTTNVSTLRPESLISQEAVVRRVTMPYEVRIKPEFADENGRLKRELRTGDIDVDVYSFHQWNPMDGSVSNRGIGYATLASRLRAKLSEHHDKFGKSKANLVNHARKIFNESGITIRTINGDVIPLEALPEVQAWPWTRTVTGVRTEAGHTLLMESIENWIASLNDESFERELPSLTLEAMCVRDYPNTEWTPDLIRDYAHAVADEFIGLYRITEEIESSYLEVATELYNFVNDWMQFTIIK